MASPTLDATAGGATTNSLITRADAQLYFDTRLDVAEWTAAGDADKDRALIMASYRLDQEEYDGSKVSDTQALKWPRYSTYDDDGYVHDHSTIPEPVQQACCELALALLKAPTLLADTGLEGFEHTQVGSLQVKPRMSRKAGTLPANVVRLLHSVRTGSEGITGRVDRG